MCIRYSRSKEQSEDFFQECMVIIFAKIDKYNPEKGLIEHWAYRLAVNVVLGELRKEKKKPDIVYLDNVPDSSIEEGDLERIAPEDLAKTIQEIPAGYRIVLNLFIFEGWTHTEIARELDISEGASRARLSRAKKLIKKRLIHTENRRYERRLAK